MDSIANKFGNRLKTLRQKAGLSQDELGKMLGVSRGAISFYENGDRTPNIDFLMEVSSKFKVSLDYLVGNHNSFKPASPGKIELLSSNLTSNAVDCLAKLSKDYGEILSVILAHPNMKVILQKIDEACIAERRELFCAIEEFSSEDSPKEPVDEVELFNEDLFEFEITRLFNGIAHAVIAVNVHGNMTDVELNRMHQSFEKMLKKYGNMKVVSPEMDEKFNQTIRDVREYTQNVQKLGESDGDNSETR